ncbi:hypothetical protein DEO72_LG10g2069 [Vigna unguiculata]|uniref:Uncharacterized protein n=1 Tax=Vigna unguiculata TaxID=3917 RepID=A0A4D6NFV4_VIGUN|nr:hypothetical protein DEO72_LG10g2069 [Vigna unguiculata]
MEDVFGGAFRCCCVRTTRGMHRSGSGGVYGRRSKVHEWWRLCVASQILVSLTVRESNEGWWWLHEWFSEFMVVVVVAVELMECGFKGGRDACRPEAVQNRGALTVQRWWFQSEHDSGDCIFCVEHGRFARKDGGGMSVGVVGAARTILAS